MTARRPTTYKASYEQELHRRQHLERRVEAMQQEIDALKWRLHVAESRPEPTAEERAMEAQQRAYCEKSAQGGVDAYNLGFWAGLIRGGSPLW